MYEKVLLGLLLKSVGVKIMKFLDGYKTYIAAAMFATVAALNALGFQEEARVVEQIAIALGLAGIGHKVAKLK